MPSPVAPASARTPPPRRSDDPTHARILDAAEQLFARHGVRRTSIDDVARRARVGRNTVFRRLGSKDELVRAVLERNMLALFADLDRAAETAPGPLERLVEVFTLTVRAFRTHPMMRSSLADHPDEIAELSSFGDAEFIRLSAGYVAGLLIADRDRGDLPADVAVEPIAEAVVRLVHSVMLAPTLVCPLDSDRDLRAFATAVLRPHLG